GISVSQEEVTTAESEWSLEDLQAAEPYPLPEITPQAIAEFLASTESAATQGGSSSPGGEPETTGAAGAKGSGDDQPTAGHPYPPPFNQHEVLVPYTTYPYITVGKLFFRQNGGSYVASASSIGNNGIWTAGHCVHAGDNKPSGWSTNMVFIPGYRDNVAP